MSNIKAEKRAEAAEDAVFPCILKILPQFVFMKKDPIILGCEIVAGIAKVGALLAASKHLVGGCRASAIVALTVETAWNSDLGGL